MDSNQRPHNDPIDVNDVLYRLSHATKYDVLIGTEDMIPCKEKMVKQNFLQFPGRSSYGFTRSGRSMVWNTLL